MTDKVINKVNIDIELGDLKLSDIQVKYLVNSVKEFTHLLTEKGLPTDENAKLFESMRKSRYDEFNKDDLPKEMSLTISHEENIALGQLRNICSELEMNLTVTFFVNGDGSIYISDSDDNEDIEFVFKNKPKSEDELDIFKAISEALVLLVAL